MRRLLPLHLLFIILTQFYFNFLAFYLDYGNLVYYLTIWFNGSVATNSNFLLDILCYMVITWRWPLTKAETCRYHREHEIKHILLIVANEGFVLWFEEDQWLWLISLVSGVFYLFSQEKFERVLFTMATNMLLYQLLT
jgi:Na+/melibiose symporter-like transporter